MPSSIIPATHCIRDDTYMCPWHTWCWESWYKTLQFFARCKLSSRVAG